MTNKEAYICLNLLPHIGPVKVRQLLDKIGEPENIFKESTKVLKSIQGIGQKIADTIVNWEKNCDLNTELNLIERSGVEVLTISDEEYPPLLKEIYDRPLCLYIRGNKSIMKNGLTNLAVVGSRHMSRYGADVAKKFAQSAVATSWTIVSGLARGVDTCAHQATVDAGGVTIAVLGSGLGHIYPQENINLAKAICEKGAVISEFPMNYPPDKRTFPMRNRIISGMSRGTLVVEAGDKSGSLITASQALEQNREVFAVPGRIDTPHSRGCHSLIKQGALLVQSFEDILDNFSYLPLEFNFSEKKQSQEVVIKSQVLDNLSDLEKEIIDCLKAGEMSIDNLVEELQAPLGKLFSALIEMETKKLVTPLPGKRYILRTS